MGRKSKEKMEAERRYLLAFTISANRSIKFLRCWETTLEPYRPFLIGLDCEGRTKTSAEQCSNLPNDKRGPAY